jgi:hypothetical protein
MPVLAAWIIRLIIPGADRLRRKEALIVAATVISVMAVAFIVGTQHPHVLSCDDFSISGNFAPEDCTPGSASTIS